MKARKIGIVKNTDLFRDQINERWPDYGDILPDPEETPDGKLFVLSGALFQLQAGAWVSVT